MPSDLERRTAAIRLPVARLAGLAGVDKHTVHRMFAGRRNSYAVNVEAVRQALEAEERLLLAHLVRLHPDAARVYAECDGAPAAPSPATQDLAAQGLAA